MPNVDNPGRFRSFVQDMTRLLERHGMDEPGMLEGGERLLAPLVATDDWLPDAFAVPSNDSYRQYLLYRDPLERFSAVSIHVYGANIGAVRRHTFDAASGAPREFISGYHNDVMPNLWDRSREAR